jgi:hypothetical protein
MTYFKKINVVSICNSRRKENKDNSYLGKPPAVREESQLLTLENLTIKNTFIFDTV